MPSVYIQNQRVQLEANMVIGKGGEADIYKLDDQTVLKLYKKSSDPDYVGNTDAQLGAKLRIQEQQDKLAQFPSNLPQQVIAPTDLAYDKAGSQIVGYTMPFVSDMEVLMRLSDRQYRETGGIDANQVVSVFRELREVVATTHSKQVVIGDFNDLNVLTGNKGVRVIDADSMQFGGFHCHTFTNRFVDPLRCGTTSLTLTAPHNEQSDWYAYSIMLMQSLLYVGPYGGVHRPKAGKRLQHDARVLNRLTVFGSDIIYPKPALALGSLPDEFLDYFQSVFEKDKREEFPLRLLNGLRWTTCKNCGAIHARGVCPSCALPGEVKEAVTIRGTVTARRIFQTKGRLLHVTMQANKLRYLYHEDNAFYREGGTKLLQGKLDSTLRFRIQGSTTLIGKNTTLLSINEHGESERYSTGLYHGILPVFDANARHSYWISGDQLVQSEKLGPKYVGDILPNQTLFWVGPSFGFGFYQAGLLTRSFVFDTEGRGLNDQVAIGSLPGQMIDAVCTFSDDYAWFMVTVQEQGELHHRCFVIDKSGTVLAQTDVKDGDDSWLGQGIRGHLAISSTLYVATDDGIVRVGLQNGSVAVERTFPDTEPFVTSYTQLVAGPGGLYAISNNEITLLEIR